MEQIPDIVHESWKELIGDLFEHESIKTLKYNILAKTSFYPAKADIFKVFRMPVKDVKIVMLGQDPYAKKGQATGLAFAVNNGIPAPPSLKEIMRRKNDGSMPVEYDKTLEEWESEGLFLLNSALTVHANEPGSHVKHWRYFTEQVIARLSQHHYAIYLLFGSKAQSFESCIHDGANVYTDNHLYDEEIRNYIIKKDHPASAFYGNMSNWHTGFNPFSLAKTYLKHKEGFIDQFDNNDIPFQ